MTEVTKLVEGINFVENEIPSSSLWSNLKKVADSSHIPRVSRSLERPLTAEDFEGVAELVEKHIVCLECTIRRMIKSNVMSNSLKLESHARSFLVSSLIVCGENSSNEKWTSNATIESAKDLFALLCELFQVNSDTIFEDLERKWEVNVCRLILLALKPKLQKEVWKQCPASFRCYKWTLQKAKMSQISEDFEEFVHPALIVLDDYEVCNQVEAIGCLSHIIFNVTRTDLCHLGYEDVIYNALEPLLYIKEPDVVLSLVPCVTEFLQKVEKGYTRKEDSLQLTRYDKVLKIVLGNMEMEQYLARRRTYVQVLPSLLNSMGLPMVRWSKKLLSIFEDYLLVDDDSEGVSTKMTLEALKVYILHTWPLVPENMDVLLEMLLKLLIEMTDLNPARVISIEILEDILRLVEECLTLVVKTSSSKAKGLCCGIHSVSQNEKFVEIANRVFPLQEVPSSKDNNQQSQF